MGAVSTTMKANWRKRVRSNTKGLDSFHAFSRCAMTFEQESIARAERQATAMGGSFMMRRMTGRGRGVQACKVPGCLRDRNAKDRCGMVMPEGCYVKRPLEEAVDWCKPERRDSVQVSDMMLNVEHAVEIILHISKVLGVAGPRNLGVTGPIGWLPKIDLSMTKRSSSPVFQ
jgi:hypothetical protein